MEVGALLSVLTTARPLAEYRDITDGNPVAAGMGAAAAVAAVAAVAVAAAAAAGAAEAGAAEAAAEAAAATFWEDVQNVGEAKKGGDTG
mmetsp:Transcript_5789/g.13340  ORF Transcript_5789/g.13340 Transcript_5789/m.13340 type:complete len:89 (-) Transcript_5789:858-1124(-)